MQWKFEFYCNWFGINASQVHEVCVPRRNISRGQPSDGRLVSVRDRVRYVENLCFHLTTVTRKIQFEIYSIDYYSSPKDVLTAGTLDLHGCRLVPAIKPFIRHIVACHDFRLTNCTNIFTRKGLPSLDGYSPIKQHVEYFLHYYKIPIEHPYNNDGFYIIRFPLNINFNI